MVILPKRNNNFGLYQNQKGQALLIILLILSVALTVSLSAVSRSVVDVSVSNYEEESSRAFSIAEAGVEEALIQDTAVGDILPPLTIPGSDDEANVEVTGDSISGPGYKYEGELNSGESAFIWFVERDSLGQLKCTGDCSGAKKLNKICWGTKASYDSNDYPAIELTVFYDNTLNTINSADYSGVQWKTIGFHPDVTEATKIGYKTATVDAKCKIGGDKAEHFFKASGIKFEDDAGLPNSCVGTKGCILALRLRKLYGSNSENVAITFPGGIPPQGREIVSTGSSGDIQRKVQVFKSHPEPLEIFNSALFSQAGLVK